MLLLSCPDRRGIVAAVANFLVDHGGNVLHADQHVDAVEGVFFQRVEFDLDGFALDRAAIAPAFRTRVAEPFAMDATVRFSDERPPVAVLASRQPHCLADLLMRWSAGELPADLRVVVSNHPDHAPLCAGLGVPYVHLPVGPEPGAKARQEQAVLATLADHGVELVVLARYMQILSPAFIAAHRNRTINIHHSFLPAFVGAGPYAKAKARGVKLIGATAHYVTDELDEGPIIEQDVVRVTHAQSVQDLQRRGADVERAVLSRAVQWHSEDRVIRHGNYTIVFA